MLMSETGGALASLEVCDNVDLQAVVQEFEAYYTMRFSKAPKLTRKVQREESAGSELRSGRTTKARRLVKSSRPPLPQIDSPGAARRETNADQHAPPPATPPSLQDDAGVSEARTARRGSSSFTRRRGPTPPNPAAAASSDHDVDMGLAGRSCRSEAAEPNLRKGPPQIINYGKELQAAIHGQAPLLKHEDAPEHFHEARILKPIAGMGWVVQPPLLAAAIPQDKLEKRKRVLRQR